MLLRTARDADASALSKPGRQRSSSSAATGKSRKFYVWRICGTAAVFSSHRLRYLWPVGLVPVSPR